jgi:predicted acyltransferase
MSEGTHKDRLLSLDLLRGLTVIVMIVVNSVGDPTFATMRHSTWAGYTLADSVFPAFIVMVGVSIAVAMAGVKARGEVDGKLIGHITLRTLRLIAFGLLVSNLYWLIDLSHNHFRYFGVLQRIGLAFFATALIYLTCGPRVRLAIIAVLLLAYWPLTLIPMPDGAVTDLNKVGANFVSWSERAWLGVHAWRQGPAGYDPEGPLSTIPVIAQALIGVAAGEWMLRHGRTATTAGGLAFAGAVLLAAGLAWGLVFPPVKSIWTSSYVLLSTGSALMLLALLFAVFDIKGWRVWGQGFVLAFGVNAIFAYVVHEVGSFALQTDAAEWVHDQAAGFVPDKIATLAPVAVFVLGIWGMVGYMYRRNWIVRA